MQIPSAIVTLVIGMLLALGGLWIGQNINLLPIDASVNAPIYDELFQVLFTIGTILFVGIVGLLIYSLIRFRRRSGQLGDGIAIEGNLPPGDFLDSSTGDCCAVRWPLQLRHLRPHGRNGAAGSRPHGCDR